MSSAATWRCAGNGVVAGFQERAERGIPVAQREGTPRINSGVELRKRSPRVKRLVPIALVGLLLQPWLAPAQTVQSTQNLTNDTAQDVEPTLVSVNFQGSLRRVLAFMKYGTGPRILVSNTTAAAVFPTPGAADMLQHVGYL